MLSTGVQNEHLHYVKLFRFSYRYETKKRKDFFDASEFVVVFVEPKKAYYGLIFVVLLRFSLNWKPVTYSYGIARLPQTVHW